MKYYFFPEDIAVLERTVKELYDKLRELGKEQGEAAGQSTENFGHDDAGQELVYQDRRVVIARLKNLQEMVNNAVIISPVGPFNKVRIGAVVHLGDGRIVRVGSFMVLADHQITNISYNSPLGRVLLDKEVGDKIEFRGSFLSISNIE